MFIKLNYSFTKKLRALHYFLLFVLDSSQVIMVKVPRSEYSLTLEKCLISISEESRLMKQPFQVDVNLLESLFHVLNPTLSIQMNFCWTP